MSQLRWEPIENVFALGILILSCLFVLGLHDAIKIVIQLGNFNRIGYQNLISLGVLFFH